MLTPTLPSNDNLPQVFEEGPWSAFLHFLSHPQLRFLTLLTPRDDNLPQTLEESPNPIKDDSQVVANDTGLVQDSQPQAINDSERELVIALLINLNYLLTTEVCFRLT